MPLVGASPIYRPPVAGEPLRLREDGHWSTKGLVGYWPMNEMRGGIVQDVSPYGNHGTLVNGPTWVAGEDGRGAVSPVDATGAIHISAPIDLRECTLIAWVWWDGSDPTQRHYIWGERARWDLPGEAYWWWDSSNVQWWGGYDFGNAYTTSASISISQWTQVVVTNDHANSEVRMYVGGVLAGSGVAAHAGVGRYRYHMNYSPFLNRAIPGTHYGPFGMYERILSADEIRALSAAPDLPIWRPRRGISLAALAVPTGRPRPFTQHRHGPRLVLGGST